MSISLKGVNQFALLRLREAFLQIFEGRMPFCWEMIIVDFCSTATAKSPAKTLREASLGCFKHEYRRPWFHAGPGKASCPSRGEPVPRIITLTERTEPKPCRTLCEDLRGQHVCMQILAVHSDGLRVKTSRTVDCRRVEQRLRFSCEGCRHFDGLQKLLSALIR